MSRTKKNKKKTPQPRNAYFLDARFRKAGAMKDKKKYSRKEKHQKKGDE